MSVIDDQVAWQAFAAASAKGDLRKAVAKAVEAHNLPRPMLEAPRDRPFLVWHASEWRVVHLDCNTDDLVFTSDGKLWTAKCWWPLPEEPTTNEGTL